MSAVNKARYKNFLKQAQGAEVNEVSVSRQEKKDKVVLNLVGKGRKGARINGSWTIAKGEKDEAAINAEINEFLAATRKTFFVKRGEGLSGEAFADARMEQKGEPIVGSAKDEKKP